MTCWLRKRIRADHQFDCGGTSEERYKGPHVTEVPSVDSSPAVPTASRRSSAQATTSNGSSGEETGTVKWFRPDRGYGFIAPNGGGKDVFVRVGSSGIEGLSEGQTVVVDVVEGRKGPEAARIRLIQSSASNVSEAGRQRREVIDRTEHKLRFV